MGQMEDLYKIFDNVNNWLKFAEAKNAMLIAFNGVSIYGILRVFDLSTEFAIWELYKWLIILMLVASAIISLISFLPQSRITSKIFSSKTGQKNLFFTEYLKSQNKDQILVAVCGCDFQPTELARDLADQIRQNSAIASRKYVQFSIALWITILAYASPLFGLVLWMYQKTNKI